MTSSTPGPAEIGVRARTIRRRRGLSLDVVAGLAGISKGYLSRLETGQRRFERRGLLDDLAAAPSDHAGTEADLCWFWRAAGHHGLPSHATVTPCLPG